MANTTAERNTQATAMSTTTPSKADTTTAVRMVTEYRNAGNGSNRTNWNRLTTILTAVLCVVRTGKSVDVTDTIIDGTSPVYHQIHRILSTDILRPMWESVTVETYKSDGTTTTTGKVGTVRAYIVPAEPV